MCKDIEVNDLVSLEHEMCPIGGRPGATPSPVEGDCRGVGAEDWVQGRDTKEGREGSVRG